MPDVINTTVSIIVIRSFNVVTTHIVGFSAPSVSCQSARLESLIDRHAVINLITTTVNHIIGEFGVVVDCVIDGFDTICVVHGESASN